MLFGPAVSYESLVLCDDVRDLASIELPDELRRATPKRRIEFLAGRRCAARALARLGCASRAPIPIGARGAPDWPAGFVGAITHGHGFAAAAVARAIDAGGVGLDSERMIDAKTAADVSSQIATDDELAALTRDLDETTALTVVFSAKESLFKCLSASVGRYFDFLDARVSRIDRRAHTFDVELRARLGDFERGTRLRGRFSHEGNFVHTGITIAPRATSSP